MWAGFPRCTILFSAASPDSSRTQSDALLAHNLSSRRQRVVLVFQYLISSGKRFWRKIPSAINGQRNRGAAIDHDVVAAVNVVGARMPDKLPADFFLAHGSYPGNWRVCILHVVEAVTKQHPAMTRCIVPTIRLCLSARYCRK